MSMSLILILILAAPKILLGSSPDGGEWPRFTSHIGERTLGRWTPPIREAEQKLAKESRSGQSLKDLRYTNSKALYYTRLVYQSHKLEKWVRVPPVLLFFFSVFISTLLMLFYCPSHTKPKATASVCFFSDAASIRVG